MQLTTEVVEMAQKEVAIAQYYTAAEEATAKHLLYQEFVEKTKWKNLPKLIFYILMDKLYTVKKAPDGNLGYCVTFKTSTDESTGAVSSNADLPAPHP